MESINIGSAPNSHEGDSLRAAFSKINDNFAELGAVSDMFAAHPISSKGLEGDIAGQLAMDDEYIYFCVTNFTNDNTDIWKRIPWQGGTW